MAQQFGEQYQTDELPGKTRSKQQVIISYLIKGVNPQWILWKINIAPGIINMWRQWRVNTCVKSSSLAQCYHPVPNTHVCICFRLIQHIRNTLQLPRQVLDGDLWLVKMVYLSNKTNHRQIHHYTNNLFMYRAVK